MRMVLLICNTKSYLIFHVNTIRIEANDDLKFIQQNSYAQLTKNMQATPPKQVSGTTFAPSIIQHDCDSTLHGILANFD